MVGAMDSGCDETFLLSLHLSNKGKKDIDRDRAVSYRFLGGPSVYPALAAPKHDELSTTGNSRAPTHAS